MSGGGEGERLLPTPDDSEDETDTPSTLLSVAAWAGDWVDEPPHPQIHLWMIPPCSTSSGFLKISCENSDILDKFPICLHVGNKFIQVHLLS